MVDRRHFAMHGQWRANNLAAKHFPNGLMPKADPKYWDHLRGLCNEFKADASFMRRARSWRKNDGVWARIDNVDNSNGVIAMHRYIGAQLSKVMNKIEGEAVVIVDQRNIGH